MHAFFVATGKELGPAFGAGPTEMFAVVPLAAFLEHTALSGGVARRVSDPETPQRRAGACLAREGEQGAAFSAPRPLVSSMPTRILRVLGGRNMTLYEIFGHAEFKEGERTKVGNAVHSMRHKKQLLATPTGTRAKNGRAVLRYRAAGVR